MERKYLLSTSVLCIENTQCRNTIYTSWLTYVADAKKIMPLTPRWFQLKHVPTLARLIKQPAKYNVIHSGRRAYKTESRKRRIVRFLGKSTVDPLFYDRPFRGLIGAPTRQQVKDIYWEDVKALIPKAWVQNGGKVSEVELKVVTFWGALIQLAGMDKPERAEGDEWDYMNLDEYGNMKKDVLEAHLMPMLSSRMGLLDLTGVPEGRNHYYDCHLRGLDPDQPDWATWGWHSGEVQGEDWIRERQQNMDPLTYEQECGGKFVAWQGRAYYQYDPDLHLRQCTYDPNAALVFCFDFNVSPGVACVVQEGADRTEVIGEVWIPRHSNTERVCDKLIADWGNHKGAIECYGDATGGAGGSAKVRGSDWDIIRAKLKPAFSNIVFRVPRSNPRVRARVNAVNSRLQSAGGEIRLVIDNSKAPHVAKDLDGVAVIEGSAGEIDKKGDPNLSHISDALGYYIAYKWPIEARILRPTGKVYVGGGAGAF